MRDMQALRAACRGALHALLSLGRASSGTASAGDCGGSGVIPHAHPLPTPSWCTTDPQDMINRAHPGRLLLAAALAAALLAGSVQAAGRALQVRGETYKH